VLYTVWCISILYAHTNNCKKKNLLKERKKGKENRKTTTAQIGTYVKACQFGAGLLARSLFAS
jgi:hypothetical protein